MLWTLDPGPSTLDVPLLTLDSRPSTLDVLCFSTVDWDHLWYHPQALMSRFARDAHRVLYVDTIGLRSPQVRDFRRIALRVRNRLGAKRGGLKLTPEGVSVYSPLLLPFLNAPLARRLNVEMLVSSLNKRMARAGMPHPVLWVYLPTWTVLQCVNRIPHRMLVYNAIDALSQNPAGVSWGYEQAEMEILQRADLVLTTSEALYQEKAPHNPHTYWAPPGVDDWWFEAADPAPEVAALPGPRIGFFGAVDHRLDLEMMAALARAHREWTFVLIGAARCDISALLAEQNVHFLGSKRHSDLVRYLVGLDVFVLPYVTDAFTRHIQPAKLYECFALGKPTVATRLPALQSYKDVVRLADGFHEFDKALQDAVAENRPDLQTRRKEIARGNAWEKRYREICGYVDIRLPLSPRAGEGGGG